MISLTINEQPLKVEEGASLLTAVEQLGLKVPTLCHHKALPPYGACRLCVVEVQAPDRTPVLQASCCFPAQEGISVLTDTERVQRARRIVAELLLARCPDSQRIQEVAASLGVSEPRVEAKNDDCIYCGLCERMCRERMGRAAIGFSGRGPHRALEPPFGRHNEACWACGACDSICPVERRVSSLASRRPLTPIPNPHNLGLDARPAVHIAYPQAVPNTAAIDATACVHLSHDVCGVCEEVCEADAIDFLQQEETVQLHVGAVILSPGFDLFDARRKPEFGYGRYPNVLSALEFERVLSASGPYAGHVQRPFDGKVPSRVAFIQCVGSRDAEHDYCSSVCCMYATKLALVAREHLGDELECDIFFMDVRAFSKGFDEFFQRAQKAGVNFIRCRPASVEEIPDTQNLRIHYLTDEDRATSSEYDLVVLSVGMEPPARVKSLATTFGIDLDQFGFCRTDGFEPVVTNRPGVFVAGPISGPKDIPETVMQASGAAAEVLRALSAAKGSLIAPQEYPPEIDVEGQEPRIGVFVCRCGMNIASVVNVPEVVEYARTLRDVVYATDNLYTCSVDTQEAIKQEIAEHRLNRVIVASCTPRTHEPLFRKTLREVGLNPYLFEMANIRDQCSWVHSREPEKATEKAKGLVRMATAKARLLEPLHGGSRDVAKAALVIGGGLAGMTASLELASQGFEVFLVERKKQLGGQLRRVRYLNGGGEPQKTLQEVVRQVEANESVHVFTQANVESIEGSVGSFVTTVASNGESAAVAHGVVVVATGAQPYRPEGYLYDEDDRVLTQLELEDRLATSAQGARTEEDMAGKTVVMIQCVGSREAERPYCSRVCCSQAIKNALKIKELAPATSVYILYRDIRVYGLQEIFYSEARSRGVAFIRFDGERKPTVSRNGDRLKVEVFDQTLGMPLKINADLVVLSAGVVADGDNEKTAKLLKVPLDSNGFFLEAHLKLRPVDFATEGVFLCGLAHSGKTVDESVAQAQAAAARASAILSKDTLDLDAAISQVLDENCDGCAYCVDPCPMNAITLFEYMSKGTVKKMVEVDEAACKGCGCCQATCPKNGVHVRGFTLGMLSAQIEAALEA
jgi:heterodisulfide reductase subunit A